MACTKIMKNSYFEILDKRQFQYGTKTVLLTVHIETIRPVLIPNNSTVYSQYTDEDQDYYRVVNVYAFDEAEEIPENIEGVSMQRRHSDSDIKYEKSNADAIRCNTFCRIRQEPETRSTGIKKYGPSYWIHRLLGENEPHLKYMSEGPHVDLLTQLEDTIQPVLEEIDRQENLSNSSVDIAVDVAVDDLEGTAKSSSEEIAEEVVGASPDEYEPVS